MLIRIRTTVPIVLCLLCPVLLCAQAPLELSLKQAIDLALNSDRNTRLAIAAESAEAAGTRLAESRAAQRPVVDGSLREQNQRVNLAAMGLDSVKIPVPGFTFPDRVGPFNTFDARASVTYSVVDLAARRRTRASAAGVEVAKAETDTTRNQIAADVTTSYVAALRADAAVDAAQADIDLANALLKQAQDREEAAHGLAIDITRARAQISASQQQFIAAESNRERAHLQLLSAIDLNLDTPVRLTDPLRFTGVPAPSVAEAVALAQKSRPEFAVFQKRETNTQLNQDAIRSERLPSVVAYGDYGALVGGTSHSAETYTAGVALRVPLFDGGRRDSRITETAVEQRLDQLRQRDLRTQIELEIRQSLASLRAAELQVKSSDEQVALAEEELAQSRRRFDAGLSGILEVIEAQTRLARARDNHVEALFRYQQARVDLSRATGTIRDLNL
jgi:outer membrane protein TolC